MSWGVCWLLALTSLSNRRWKILFISVTLWKNYWHSFYPSLYLRRKLAHTRDSGMPSSHSMCCSFKGLSVKNCSAPPLFFFCASFPLPTKARGLDHIAENILSYLDARSLCAAELVCKEWYRVTSDGMLWKKLIERMVRTDSLWRGLAERRGWWAFTFLLPKRSHSEFWKSVRPLRIIDSYYADL